MNKLPLLLTLLLAACGTTTATDMDMSAPDAGENIPEDDTTAPTVFSMSPETGSIGVREDAVLVIEFSEPMDQLSVQNSLDTTDFAGVKFAWSNDDRTLTITPDEPLLYAKSIDPDGLSAIEYALAIGTNATDRAGNPLAQEGQTSFTTLREISVTVDDINELSASVTPSKVSRALDADVYIGDDGAGGLAVASRGVVTMDLSSLPDETVEISSATFKSFQSGTNGLVFVELGALLMEHVTFDVTGGSFATATNPDCNAAFNIAPLSNVGTLMGSDADINVELDATAQVQDDLENRAARNDRSQYRMRLFDDLNLDNGLDGVSLHRDFFKLDLVYLLP
jgi:hypothetical protein